MHPLVQWHRLVGAVDPRNATDGQGAGPPREGALVDELVAHPALEAVEVQPGDSLAWDADELD